MDRRMLFAGALTLAVVQPTATRAASPTGIPVYRPPAQPRVAAGTASRSTYGNTFKLHVDLSRAPSHAEVEPTLAFPRFLPAPGCFANNAPTSQWTQPYASTEPGAGETLGSLVDARSRNLFASKPSQATQLPLSDDSALTQSPLTIQYGVAPLTCGPPSMLNPPLP
jgi:hypothetical protein